MDIKTKLEAEFKTLDDDNPIEVTFDDIVLELQRVGVKCFGEDTIAVHLGISDLQDPIQFNATFAIHSRKDGKWVSVTEIEVFCEWAARPGAFFRVYEIEEH
jgi:hypothetical protein